MEKMFRSCSEFNQPLNIWDVRKVRNNFEMFNGAWKMEEKNKPSVEKYNQYLKQTRETGVMVADEVFASRHKNTRGSKPLPEEISREILEYLPMGNIKNADIATSSGYRQSLKREALRPLPSASGLTASDALGGRTRRRRRNNKRNNKRKTRKTKKTRHTKRH
jgi:hypothetical protein